MKAVFPCLLIASLPFPVHAGVLTIPHPAAEFATEETVVWSPAFQAAWDSLNAAKGSLPARIDPPDEVMSALDGCRWNPTSVMPETGWKAWGGKATPELLDRVNREAKPITGEEKTFNASAGSPTADLAAYCVLKRDITFAAPLYRSTKSPLDFRAPAGPFSASFFGSAGANSAAFFGIVDILSHTPGEKSLAVRIHGQDTDESVVLYLPAAPENMATACASVGKLIAAFKPEGGIRGALGDPFLHENDELKIPYVSLVADGEFPGLLKPSRYYQGETAPWKIVRASQSTAFDLHEKGARVKAKASADAAPFGEAPKPLPAVPRKFIFDRPFFVFLWRNKAESPYFAAWIGDSSALKAFAAQ